jgi:uncharacterized SAM-binding protein YcdF (DUF218 family)
MYELINLILQPLTFLLLCLIIWLAWVWRAKPQARRVLTPGFLLLATLWFLSTPLAAYLVRGMVEWPVPPTDEAPTKDDIVVVLSGDMCVDDERGAKVRIGPSTFYRCLHAAKLYKQAGGCRVIVTGGRPDGTLPTPTLAQVMSDFLVEFDIEADDITLEMAATSTYENALYSAALLKNRGSARVFLVTDSSHMYRAHRCFLKQGITTIPAPCDYRLRKLEQVVSTAFPSVEAMMVVQGAVHERLGLAWYWLRGRI